MMKRFIFGSLLRKLPLFIILTVVFASISIFSSINIDFIIRYNEIGNGYYFANFNEPGFTGLVVFFFIIMMVLPLFSMNYRYSLAKSDVYRQVAFKSKHIRYAEHLSTLVTVLISFTFAFILLVSILVITNYTAHLNTSVYSPLYGIGYFNYIYFLPLYLAIAILGVAQYFISYLIVSRSNCLRNSIITLLSGQVALLSICIIFYIYVKDIYIANASFILYLGASVGLPVGWILGVFTPAILYNENWFTTLSCEAENLGYANFVIVLSTVVFFGLAILGLIVFIKEKDPSGEFAGKSNTKKPYQEIIFHVGFALFGLYLSSFVLSTSIVSYFLFLVFFVAAYYPLYGTLIHNFKLKPWQIAIMVGVIVFIIMVGLSGQAVMDYRNFYEY